jgi:hypothetical protein
MAPHVAGWEGLAVTKRGAKPKTISVSGEVAAEMLSKLKKIWGWLDMCATNREAEAEKYRGRFDSLVDSTTRDAKNFRATATSVLETIALADPEWAEKAS